MRVLLRESNRTAAREKRKTNLRRAAVAVCSAALGSALTVPRVSSATFADLSAKPARTAHFLLARNRLPTASARAAVAPSAARALSASARRCRRSSDRDGAACTSACASARSSSCSSWNANSFHWSAVQSSIAAASASIAATSASIIRAFNAAVSASIARASSAAVFTARPATAASSCERTGGHRQPGQWQPSADAWAGWAT